MAEVMTTDQSDSESGLSATEERLSRLDTDKMRVSSAERRSPSPGIARRIVTDSDKDSTQESVESSANTDIDDLSKKLANSLLDRSNTVEQPPKYISMNEQRLKNEETLKVNKPESVSDTPAAVHDSHLTESISINRENPQTSVGLEPHINQLTNGTCNNSSSNLSRTIQFGMWLSKECDLDNPWAVGLEPTVSHSIPKPSTNGTSDLLNFDKEKEMNGLGEDNLISVEVDVLTAISGQATPSSLPNVLDGISDGEISSDDSEGEEELTIEQTTHMSNRSTSTQLSADPFFTNHQLIMNNKNTDQKQQLSDAILDIRSAVTTIQSGELNATGKASAIQEQTVTNPIWEIRESYAETLRIQEQKRRERVELERRYEEEYRELQMEELEAIDSAGKPPAAHSLEVEEDEEDVMNTDYSSDEDGMLEHDLEIGQGWTWGGGGGKNYTRVSRDDSEGKLSHTTTSGQMSQMLQSSNASRLAEYHQTTSPRAPRKHPMGTRDGRLSNSSLNSYTSSSQSSSMAPSTVIRCHKSDEPSNDSSDSSSSSSTSNTSSNSWVDRDRGRTSPTHHRSVSSGSTAARAGEGTSPKRRKADGEYDTDEETDKLLHKPYTSEAKVDLPADTRELGQQAMKNRAKEVTVYDPDEPTVLIEGILFRAAYLGSTQLVSEAQPSKAIRMMQAQEAVGRIKALGTMHFGEHYQAPEGESQPSTDVDLFVSTEKVMVLNTDLQEIMMDHTLRSISYIADIDSVLVIMAKRNMMTSSSAEGSSPSTSIRQQKLICHIFETDEAHLIAQSIGQAFQVAYMEFLKANGIEEPNIQLKDTSYEDILEQQEIMNDELETFTRKDKNKEVVVPKSKGEALGIVIVESGWGSVLPTVILANMSPTGAAARCGQLNIGDQIMSVNGISLVGLPLSTCQEHVKAVKNLTAVRLCLVSRPPVVEVLIRRPDRKYQLGFSVQNGVICSLLRGGIAERGGIRVGHRIIEINGQSVVAVTHDKIVQMLSTSVGEIHMKTMPMAVFRLLTGQEVPQYI